MGEGYIFSYSRYFGVIGVYELSPSASENNAVFWKISQVRFGHYPIVLFVHNGIIPLVKLKKERTIGNFDEGVEIIYID